MKKNSFCTKTELVNFEITLPAAKFHLVGSRLVSKALIFSNDILADIQVITFLLLSNIRERSIGANTRTLYLTKNHTFSDICTILFESFFSFLVSIYSVFFDLALLFKIFSF